MTGDRAAFGEAARQLVGSPFRLHGRDPRSGLDCLGLVQASLVAIGRVPPRPPAYNLRLLDIAQHLALLPQAGFMAAEGGVHAGDLVLVRPGPGQFHLVIAATKRSFVHAHASLGRVVECPAPLPWPLAGHWRLA